MKKALFLFCAALLLWAVIFVIKQPHDNDAADLLEAYKIANTEALRWNSSAKPYFITSVDDPIKSNAVKGEDGKRNVWNFDFAVENTDRHLIVTVHNKAVVNKIEAQSHVDSEYILNMRELCISTQEAVMIARETYGLLPGTDWAQGYHFVLENKGSVLVLSVVGLDKGGTMSRVFLNARTGEVIR